MYRVSSSSSSSSNSSFDIEDVTNDDDDDDSSSSSSSSSSLTSVSSVDDDDDDDFEIKFDKSVSFNVDQNIYYEPLEGDGGNRGGAWVSDSWRFNQRVSCLAKLMDPIINYKASIIFQQHVFEKKFSVLNQSIFASTVPGFNVDEFISSVDIDNVSFQPITDLSVYGNVALYIDEQGVEAFVQHLYRFFLTERSSSFIKMVAALFQMAYGGNCNRWWTITETQRSLHGQCLRKLWRLVYDIPTIRDEFDNYNDDIPLTSFWLSFVTVFCDPGNELKSILAMCLID